MFQVFASFFKLSVQLSIMPMLAYANLENIYTPVCRQPNAIPTWHILALFIAYLAHELQMKMPSDNRRFNAAEWLRQYSATKKIINIVTIVNTSTLAAAAFDLSKFVWL
jgi:hypothetical protein